MINLQAAELSGLFTGLLLFSVPFVTLYGIFIRGPKLLPRLENKVLLVALKVLVIPALYLSFQILMWAVFGEILIINSALLYLISACAAFNLIFTVTLMFTKVNRYSPKPIS